MEKVIKSYTSKKQDNINQAWKDLLKHLDTIKNKSSTEIIQDAINKSQQKLKEFDKVSYFRIRWWADLRAAGKNTWISCKFFIKSPRLSKDDKERFYPRFAKYKMVINGQPVATKMAAMNMKDVYISIKQKYKYPLIIPFYSIWPEDAVTKQFRDFNWEYKNLMLIQIYCGDSEIAREYRRIFKQKKERAYWDKRREVDEWKNVVYDYF
jgi:hypothetical protein